MLMNELLLSTDSFVVNTDVVLFGGNGGADFVLAGRLGLGGGDSCNIFSLLCDFLTWGVRFNDE